MFEASLTDALESTSSDLLWHCLHLPKAPRDLSCDPFCPEAVCLFEVAEVLSPQLSTELVIMKSGIKKHNTTDSVIEGILHLPSSPGTDFLYGCYGNRETKW